MEKYLKLKKRIKTNEGFSAVIYNDQLGFKTIGYGHLIKKNDNFKRNKSYSKKFLLKIFDEDFYICLRHFKKLYPNNNFTQTQKEVLIEMIFQLGIKNIKKFKKFNKHLKRNEIYMAAYEMLNSLWYNQTPNRVNKHIYALLGETGVKKR